MKKLKDVKAHAIRLGAKVEDTKDYGWHCCRVEAPKGHYWCEGGVHELVDETHQPWKPDYEDLLNRMAFGISPCTDADCDWCNS